MDDRSETALIALRKILRATEFNARRLAREAGLTPSQLIILGIVGRLDHATPSKIAKEASIAQATVTILLDKLEKQKLVRRMRNPKDRRQVIVSLTKEGATSLEKAPDLLQRSFEQGFNGLQDWEQSLIIAGLERVAALLDAEKIEAAPVLDVGAIDSTEPP